MFNGNLIATDEMIHSSPLAQTTGCLIKLQILQFRFKFFFHKLEISQTKKIKVALFQKVYPSPKKFAKSLTPNYFNKQSFSKSFLLYLIILGRQDCDLAYFLEMEPIGPIVITSLSTVPRII